VHADTEEAPAAPYDPGEQGDPLHAKAPAELLYVPGRHAKHAEARFKLLYVPELQRAHVEAPELEYVPALQSEHSDMSEQENCKLYTY